ncbi:MAG: glutathione S-transferase family protein [Solirubrobacteraceae bacterium]|nr:glutathione S-transferase family protein [Solirubrobacteraceae bacterium]
MLLYDAAISGNCWKVRQLFAHLAIDYERKALSVVDRSDRVAELGALNPSLRIPVVVDGDGTVRIESNAILLHYAEGTDYLPGDTDGRDEVIRWLMFEQANHQPYLAMPWFLTCVMPGDPEPNAFGFMQLMGKLALKAMDAHLAAGESGWFAAGRYTIADIALYPYVARSPEAGFDLDRYGAVQAWLARVEAQPGFTTPPTREVTA